MIDIETLLKQSDPDIVGVFILNKAEFLVEGVNAPRNSRCDNMRFGPVNIAKDTQYENQVLKLNTTNSVFVVQNLRRYEIVIDAAPDFYISYLETVAVDDKSIIKMEENVAPSTMWAAKSIFQLLKNMREWSLMLGGDFNSDHPMAIYSDIALNKLQIPNNLVEEIDSWPDMHLAKFLKGDIDYKKIPHPYPAASSDMTNWIIAKVNEFSEKPIDEQLDLI